MSSVVCKNEMLSMSTIVYMYGNELRFVSSIGYKNDKFRNPRSSSEDAEVGHNDHGYVGADPEVYKDAEEEHNVRGDVYAERPASIPRSCARMRCRP